MTPQQIKAMKLALEALEGCHIYGDLECVMTPDGATYLRPAITAIKEALAEHAMRETQRLGQEIEPDDIASILACRDMLDAQPVPPRRKPLTDEQIFALENSIPDEIVSDRDWCIYFARAIEAAHGIKENT